ncbi:WD40 repeat domain-containing protein [Niabella hibiscisoli]|uniref:WD40 repeat domain-containing protein n=1 Tax=Niabella hibiscisoli TaxID=1825928 RepID=UPI001F10B389|nr:WD40 repeat domain-containing protein [Niabella hibiscisoli]MCH5720377.1 WD40 repeat domain-containing protein [Niabella hibiscisoli]
MTKHLKLRVILPVVLVFLFTTGLWAQVPFNCGNVAYQTVNDGTTTTLYSYNINTGSRSTIRTLPYPVNAAAYSPLNNLIYATRGGTNQVIGMGSSGPVVTLNVTGLESGNIGDITPDGYLLVTSSTVGTDNRYFLLISMKAAQQPMARW